VAQTEVTQLISAAFSQKSGSTFQQPASAFFHWVVKVLPSNVVTEHRGYIAKRRTQSISPKIADDSWFLICWVNLDEPNYA
jgi:hypothetical protein